MWEQEDIYESEKERKKERKEERKDEKRGHDGIGEKQTTKNTYI